MRIVIIAAASVALVAGKSPPLESVCYGFSELHPTMNATKKATKYLGNLNSTVSGLACLPWAAEPGSEDEDHSSVLNEFHNFCRGVDTRSGRPWCYVDLESSKLSERHVGIRRGWDWCGVPHCHYYATECQEKLQRFERAERDVQRGIPEGIVNEYCRPNCDTNGDFEELQTCNENYMNTTEQTGRCVSWNNREHEDLVFNYNTNQCEKWTKCRYARWNGEKIECDENGIEIQQVIIPVDVITTHSATTVTATSDGPPTTIATEPQPLMTEPEPEMELITEATDPEKLLPEPELEVLDESSSKPDATFSAGKELDISGSGSDEIGSGVPLVKAAPVITENAPKTSLNLETYYVGELACKKLPLPTQCNTMQDIELELFNRLEGFGAECLNMCDDLCCSQGQYCIPSKGVCAFEE